MTRFGSITPTTIPVEGFTPIAPDYLHIVAEMSESAATKSSLSARKRDMQSSAAGSVTKY